ncbi:hypothetical protein Gogos_020757 [Gossypium gossypioides]|uniref:Uncharacterized protein n=1 Tax=Gossypium gossypioides TaxID=34282 RepID=A0A7J9CZH5_GOSGO|nr:hypothetical protein [Gossypium gossypioides]
MQKWLGRVNAASKVHCKHSDNVFYSDLLVWQSRMKPRCENLGDSNWNKSKFGKVKAETSCQRDVPMSVTIQVKKRQKSR